MNKIHILPTILLIIMLIGCGAGNPDTHAENFMKLLKDGKHLAVQEYLTKDMNKMAMLLGGVSNDSLNPYYRTGKIVNYSLIRMQETEKSVRYKVTVTCTDGKKYTDFIDLQKQGGKWKVARF